jgi:hypothetical protein
MSQHARDWLVSHPNTIFQQDSQRADLRDSGTTQTELIALLIDVVQKGHIVLFTAVKSDHHDDSALGQHCHFKGFCADVWPLKSTSPTDFVDANAPEMAAFLRDAAHSAWLYQIGLAGSADTTGNSVAAGPTKFSDGGADHIHLGANSD